MKGKRPNTVNALRAEILSDEKQLTPYVEQRLISQLGGLIDRVLTERQLTQTKLAQAVQMYQPDLNALIRGRAEHIPTIPTLRRLSAGLGVAIAIHIDPNGTIQLTEEKAADATQTAKQEFVAPSTPTEVALTTIFGEVLNLERVSSTADLLKLGADSNQLFQITARANRAGIKITARQLLQHRNAAALGALADSGGGEAADSDEAHYESAG